jgi:hypothetical protein
MSGPRKELTVSYRIVDESGKTLEIHKESGLNKNYIKWIVERKMRKKYGNKIEIQRIKIVEETT